MTADERVATAAVAGSLKFEGGRYEIVSMESLRSMESLICPVTMMLQYYDSKAKKDLLERKGLTL